MLHICRSNKRNPISHSNNLHIDHSIKCPNFLRLKFFFCTICTILLIVSWLSRHLSVNMHQNLTANTIVSSGIILKNHIFKLWKFILISLFVPEIEKRGNRIFSWRITILIQKEFYGPEFDSSGNKVGKNHQIQLQLDL